MTIKTVSIAAVVSTVIVILAIAGGSLYVNHKVDKSISPTQPSEINSIQFLGLCSGIPSVNNRETVTISVSNCLGRIRGFVDGHNTTVALNSMVGNNVDVLLWCIDPAVPAEQLITNVLDWVDTHPTQYEEVITHADGKDQAMIITVKALREEYPCPNP